MPETKVLASAIVVIIGAAVTVVNDLQSSGMELPGWVAVVVAVLAPLVGYTVRNGNLSPSTLDAAARQS